MSDPKQKYSVECWNCGGDGYCEEFGWDDFEPPVCEICKGAGFYIVTELTEDNYDRAIPIYD